MIGAVVKEEKILKNLIKANRVGFKAKKGELPMAIGSVLLTAGVLTPGKIANKIHERTGEIWKVSSGAIYPALENLTYQRLVETQRFFDPETGAYGDGYKLSETGKRWIQSSKHEEFWKMFSAEDEKKYPLDVELDKFLEAITIVRKNKPESVSHLRERVVPELTKAIYSMLAK